MSARKEYHPEQVRTRLSHPVIDGDGHWIEYGPVFAEQMRKVAGDKAADGLVRHMRRIPDTLSLLDRRTAAARHRYGGLLGAPVHQYPRPRHRDDAAHAV